MYWVYCICIYHIFIIIYKNIRILGISKYKKLNNIIKAALVALSVRRRGKYRRVKVKRKWWVSAQPPYSLEGNGRQSPEWNLMGDRPSNVEDNPGNHQRLGGQAGPQVHFKYIHIQQEWQEYGSSTPLTNEFKFSSPQKLNIFLKHNDNEFNFKLKRFGSWCY